MSKKEIKIMNYNVLHGFHTYGEEPFILEAERLKAAQKIVKKENPDMLILTEACFAEDNRHGIKMDYKNLFNYPYHTHAKVGSEWGSSLLSKYPIISAKNYSMDRRNFLRSVIDVNGEEIHVDVAHPHPDVSEFERKRFFHSHLRDIPNKPYILAGDFNALSDKDVYNKKNLTEGFAAFMGNKESAKKAVDSMLTHQAIPEIRAHNLIDTYSQIQEETNHTIPTDYLSLDKRSGIRVDYIFCSPHFDVKDAKIIKDKYTNKASDHYPITAVLSLGDKKNV